MTKIYKVCKVFDSNHKIASDTVSLTKYYDVALDVGSLLSHQYPNNLYCVFELDPSTSEITLCESFLSRSGS